MTGAAVIVDSSKNPVFGALLTPLLLRYGYLSKRRSWVTTAGESSDGERRSVGGMALAQVADHKLESDRT